MCSNLSVDNFMCSVVDAGLSDHGAVLGRFILKKRERDGLRSKYMVDYLVKIIIIVFIRSVLMFVGTTFLIRRTLSTHFMLY